MHTKKSFIKVLKFIYRWTGIRSLRLFYRRLITERSEYQTVERIKERLRLRQLLKGRPLKHFLGAPISVKRKWNYFLTMLSARLGLKRCLGHPLHLTIEPINACDQKCTICETGQGILGRKKEIMSLDNFKTIINNFNLDYLEQIFFYFMGESFLNKDAYDCIRYAVDKGIHVAACTNGNAIDPERLVTCGISEIHFQLGGMTQKTHGTYRIRGNLDHALKNLEKILRLKGKDLKVICGFILMKHNEHEVPQFIEYCQKIGVDEYSVIGTCLRNHWEGEIYLPSDRNYWIYDEEQYWQGNLVPKVRPNNYCGWLYTSTNVLVNGDVVPCCRDPKGKHVLGNVLESPFRKTWNNSNYRRMRAHVAKMSNTLPLCQLCPGEEVVEFGKNSLEV